MGVADWKQLGENFWESQDGKLRIEAGLPVKTAIATPELLNDDVTHPDYKAGLVAASFMGGGPILVKMDANGDPMIDEMGNLVPGNQPLMVPAKDARGQKIEHGKEMTYIDFYAARDHALGKRPHPHDFKVYRLEDAPDHTPHKWIWDQEAGTTRLVPDLDHPEFGKRWIKYGEFDTLPEAEDFADNLSSDAVPLHPPKEWKKP
jgi:hypothetical protein